MLPKNFDLEVTDFVVELASKEQIEEPTPKPSLNAMNSAIGSGAMNSQWHLVNILLDGNSDDSFI